MAPVRYLTFSTPGNATPRLGAVHGDMVVDVRSLATVAGAPPLPGDLLELVHQGPAASRRISEFLRTELSGSARHGETYPLSETRPHAPIPRPSKNVFCVGMHFHGLGKGFFKRIIISQHCKERSIIEAD